MSFDYLKKLEISESDTIDFVIEELIGRPVIKLSPATKANKEYFNKLLRKANSKRSVKRRIDAVAIDEYRDINKNLFPQHVIKGWEGIVNDKGEEVEFSVLACVELINALPEDIFDEIVLFATDPANFRDEDIDVEELGKNSQIDSSGS